MSRKDFIAGYMAAMNGTGKMAWNSPKEIPAVAEDFIDHCESIGNPVSDASEIYEFAHFLEQRYASRKRADGREDLITGCMAGKKAYRKSAGISEEDAEFITRQVCDVIESNYSHESGDDLISTIFAVIDEALDAWEFGSKPKDEDIQAVYDKVLVELDSRGIQIWPGERNSSRRRLMRKRGGSFYDKMFGEGEKVNETYFGTDDAGRRYEVHIWESSEPGTWGQANFNYSIYDADTHEYLMSHDYIMKMDALWERLNDDLAKYGITLD